jgi:hypothetical protein
MNTSDSPFAEVYETARVPIPAQNILIEKQTP